MRMKRAAACVLSLLLCLQNPLTAAAALTGAKQEGTRGSSTVGTATPSDADRAEDGQGVKPGNPVLPSEVLAASGQDQDDKKETRGAVQVEIRSVLNMVRDSEFTVSLIRTKDEEEVYSAVQTISLGSLEASDSDSVVEMAVFPDLESGDYTLAINSPGYEEYKQKIKVGQYTSRITLLNDYLPGYSFQKGESHPGILKLGDVNGDGILDEQDLNDLLEAIRSEEAGDGPGGGSDFDLNGDGYVDLTDLQYFTIFYDNPADAAAKPVRYATVKEGEVKIATGSNADGPVEDILDGREDTYITLEPEKDGPVGEDNPITLSLDMSGALADKETVGGITIAQPADTENLIEEGTISVEYISGGVVKSTGELEITPAGAAAAKSRSRMAFGARAAARVIREPNGTIVLDLNGQVAIKKITIKVTKTSGTNLADISKVEFVNDMEDRIPAPVMNIPKDLKAEAGNKQFSLTWKKEANVTGYEVAITSEGKTETVKTVENKLEVKSFGGNKMKNGITYTVKVQSVSGEWKSGYSPSITVIPVTDQRPDPPEGVTVTGAYKSLKLSWKDMEDTESYTVFYRVAGSEAEYESIPEIEKNQTVLTGLLDETEYEIYLTGKNHIGESAPSSKYKGKTTTLNPPVTPDYKLMNVPREDGQPGYNIEKVSDFGTDKAAPFAMVDHDYSTSWIREDWDAGVVYPADGIGKSPIITFEEPVEMDTIVVIPDDQQPYGYNASSVYCWPENGSGPVKVEGTLMRRVSSNQKVYYEFQSKTPFSPKKIQINFSTGWGRRISIAEIKFYYYDSLEKDIYSLYEDDMHMALRADVTEEDIGGLRTRLSTPDDVSGELHPKTEILTRELDNAEKLLKDLGVKDILQVHNDVTKNADGAITFKGGLNAFQPLGITAAAGEQIVVYVGSPGKKTGDSTNLSLVATQYHGESSWSTTVVKNLKTGANEVTVPSMTSLDVEQGGPLYVEYTGVKGKENYTVRVSGGSRVPVLDITTATSSDAKRDLVTSYVEELEAFVPQMETLHDEQHRNDFDEPLSFEEQNCILGATDIVMKNMMFSVSAKQILKGLKGSTEEKAEQLYQSLTAMEDMVALFYQHKGLSDKGNSGAKNKLPSSRLNIRYQRLPAGAFMYAGGGHIGIGWGSVTGLVTSTPIVSGENGLYESGRYFGWGIAHEIGHIINEGAYAVAEITNNYYSVLAQAKDTNDSVRFQYSDVYDKVTSGVAGPASNVFTQLGMYWQLHLAYDRGGFNYKVYDDYEEQFKNLIYARMDSYVRDTSIAPKPGGISFTTTKDKDNELMRLACAASEKNVLEFFERWGMTPDETTIKYASQFETETRAIWFVSDEARRYAMDHGDSGSVAESVTVTASVSHESGTNQVHVNMSNNAEAQEAMLGYEIYRVERHKDAKIRKPVGFVAESGEATFTDMITTVNNRVFTYEVTGYDKYLNPTRTAVTDPVKVSHGGNVDKASWTVTTNMVSDEDGQGSEDGDYEEGSTNPCEPVKNAIGKVIDGDAATTYTGKAQSQVPYVIINLNQEETVTGLVCTLKGEGRPIKAYKIYVSSNGSTWKEVKSGAFDWSTDTQTIYFNQEDGWLYAYDASYVKIVAAGQAGVELSISELDILGQAGDNIELYEDGIGLLKDDYDAGKGQQGNSVVIPGGSLIFTGTYKGNPAYNEVMLFDENGNVVGGIDASGNTVSGQMIFASVPEHGELGETSDGTWSYYIEPQDLERMAALPVSVRAELYRVDNAITSHGERLVSDTKFTALPENLPEITIVPNQNNGNTQ